MPIETLNSPRPNRWTRREVFKIASVVTVIAGAFTLFVANPSLTATTLVSMVITVLLSPVVSRLERRGLSRTSAIALVFVGITVILGSVGFWATQNALEEWETFRLQLPRYYDASIAKMQLFERRLHDRIPLARPFTIVKLASDLGDKTSDWFINHLPSVMGDLLTTLLLAPLFTFVFLKDGKEFKRRFFDLVPNRLFESTFIITHRISMSLSDYLRAKLLEATLVGVLTGAGLALLGAPYAVVLAVFAAATNVIPYVGPVFGAVPALLTMAIDPANLPYFWPVVFLYVAVNIIDNVVIFPLVVAQLVDLHPLLLIGAVVIGQRYYGVVGMLISIPFASIAKVILQELHYLIYQPAEARAQGRRKSL